MLPASRQAASASQPHASLLEQRSPRDALRACRCCINQADPPSAALTLTLA